MTQKRTAKLARKNLYIEFSYDPNKAVDRHFLDLFRQRVPDRHWEEDTFRWRVKPSLKAIEFLTEFHFQISPKDAKSLLKLIDVLVLKEQQKAMRQQYSMALHAPPIPEIESQLKLPAWDFQWAPVRYAELSDFRFLLCDQMACGKSIESLIIAAHERVKHKPKLIITPVPDTFQEQIHKFFNARSMIIDKPLYDLYPRIDYYLLTYDRLHYICDVADKKNKRKAKPRDYVGRFFAIVDEVQQAKNRDTIRNALLYTILNRSGIDERILMTGSPVMNQASEVYEYLRLLRGDDTFTWWSFVKLFCDAHTNHQGHLDIKGASNLQALRNYLYGNVMVRREKKQVQSQLPEKVRQSYRIKSDPVVITAENVFELYAKTAEYKSTDREFLSWMETALEESDKIGIFFHHKTMGDALARLCDRLGYKYIRIDGNVPKDSRQALVNKFANDPTYKAAILSINAAGTGMNGLQVANLCVFAELAYVPGVILQAEERFHRPGMKSALLVAYPLVTRFEYRLCELLLNKLAIMLRITGHEEIPDDLDDDKLLRVIANEFGLPFKK